MSRYWHVSILAWRVKSVDSDHNYWPPLKTAVQSNLLNGGSVLTLGLVETHLTSFSYCAAGCYYKVKSIHVTIMTFRLKMVWLRFWKSILNLCEKFLAKLFCFTSIADGLWEGDFTCENVLCQTVQWLDSTVSNCPMVRQCCVQLSNGWTVLYPTVS